MESGGSPSGGDGAAALTAEAPASRPPMLELRVEFTGSAREYFRIFIVNLALTLLTLGIYSAWAKVRRKRYFLGNFRLASIPFEYRADPRAILKGRIIATAFFVAYYLADYVVANSGYFLFVLLLIVSPWIIVRSLAFNAHNTAHRNIRFGFDGSVGGAARVYLLWSIAIPFTLGILYPLVKGKQKIFSVENHRFGATGFAFGARASQFYNPYLAAFGVLIAASVVFGLLGALIGFVVVLVSSTMSDPTLIGVAFAAVAYLGYFVAYCFLVALVTNFVWERTTLGEVRFAASMKGLEVLWLYFGNLVGIVCSAGLLIPWAMVRMARYRASRFRVLAPASLVELRGTHRTGQSATGSEVGDFFNVDLGL